MRAIALAAAILLIAAAGLLHGQTVSFTAFPPPPGQLTFKNLWNITLRNPTLDTWSVYFHVEASIVGTGPVFVANSQEMSLAPGDRTLKAADIKLSDVWRERGYEAFAAPGSTLPDGDYTYEITLVPEMTQTSLLLRVRAPRPVELTWPPKDAVVGDSQPVFVWKPPVVAGYFGVYRYMLRVVEVASGQNETTALSRNRAVFEDSRVAATVCRVPARAGGLVPGSTYAWRVEA